MSDDSSRARIAPVLGRTPSGVFILTVRDGNGRETGMLASWVQQASFEPPMVSIAVNRKRYIADWMRESTALVLNLIGEKQTQFVKHFARGFEPDEPAFEGLETHSAANGGTALSEAIGHLEGKVRARAEAGDHSIFLVELTDAVAGEQLDELQPMVHIRKNGFKY